MSYDYTTERRVVFTEEGIDAVLRVRDYVKRALDLGGAVMAGKAMEHAGGKGISDSFGMMAVVDYLIERGELRAVNNGPNTAWQHRVLVSNR